MIQHYAIKLVSDLRHVGSFSESSCFLNQQNWLPSYNWNIVKNGVKRHKPNLSQTNWNEIIRRVSEKKFYQVHLHQSQSVNDLGSPNHKKDVPLLILIIHCPVLVCISNPMPLHVDCSKFFLWNIPNLICQI